MQLQNQLFPAVAGTGAGQLDLGSASEVGDGAFLVEVELVSGTTFSLTPRACPIGLGNPVAGDTAVAYTNRNTGAVVSGATAITAAGLYEIPAGGASVSLFWSTTTAQVRVNVRSFSKSY